MVPDTNDGTGVSAQCGKQEAQDTVVHSVTGTRSRYNTDFAELIDNLRGEAAGGT
jgi:hypothetical protein